MINGKKYQGLRGQICERKHREKMGVAIWLFAWLCSLQTKGNGLVHGGKGFTYKAIAEDMKETPRQIERWMWRLRREGYISVKYTAYKKLVIYVLNQKKFPSRQGKFQFDKESSSTQKSGGYESAKKRRITVPKSGGFKVIEVKNEERQANESLTVSVFSTLGIPLSLWRDYKGMRERIHRPVVPGAEELLILELFDLQARGENPVAVLQQAIKTASFMLYPVRKEGAKNGNESFAEKRNRTNREGIAAGFGASLDGVDRTNGRSLPAGRFENQRGSVPRIIERSKFGGNRCGLPAGDADVGVHAHSCDDPECDSRSPVDRGDAIDANPVSGSESGGKGDRAGSPEED